MSTAEDLRKAEWRKLGPEHAAEQDRIGFPRLPEGNHRVIIERCYTVAGDPTIWLPGEDVIYFVVDVVRCEEGSPFSWVNRLRCNGWLQLRKFVAVAGRRSVASVTEAVIERVVGDEQILEGNSVVVDVAPPTAKGYMHHTWSMP